ncbi:MAG TPA: hypothetical protein VFP58_13445 [Candidatus Eisenbacteria bacterium]|nr:hypothetical protein [Candidatus Eisenbacteria bacterium]
MVHRADSILVGLVGREHFERHLTLEHCHWHDPTASHWRATGLYFEAVPYWGIVYRFRVPGKPFIDQIVQVNLTPGGRLHPLHDRLDIAACAENPRECEFPFDEAAAVHIARNGGLEEGLKPWRTGFTYNPEYGFIWTVANTLVVKEDGCSSEGRTYLIDANSGEIVARHMWTSICCYGLNSLPGGLSRPVHNHLAVLHHPPDA